MSNNTNDTAPVTLVTEENTQEPVEKLSFVQKSRAFVKNHKKPAIAVGALVGLVGVAALTGRKTDSSPSFDELSPEEQDLTPEDVVEMYDIPVPSEN